jgi:hypothetical protein
MKPLQHALLAAVSSESHSYSYVRHATVQEAVSRLRTQQGRCSLEGELARSDVSELRHCSIVNNHTFFSRCP